MRMSLFGGTRIFVSPDRPRMQLSPDVMVTPKFRKEIDAWMLGFFGVTNPIEDGRVMHINGALHMNPRTYAQLKRVSVPHFKTP